VNADRRLPIALQCFGLPVSTQTYRVATPANVRGSRLFSHVFGGTRFEANVTRGGGICSKAAPLQALGIYTFVLLSQFFDDEDEYDLSNDASPSS